MKKIDRLWETKKLVTVNTPDLNEQEAYIEQIEREKALSDDNLKAYVKMANDRQLRICNLEREKEEAVNILIDLVSSKEYTAYCACMDNGWGEKYSLKEARDEIKKEVAFLESITGKTWQELTEEWG